MINNKIFLYFIHSFFLLSVVFNIAHTFEIESLVIKADVPIKDLNINFETDFIQYNNIILKSSSNIWKSKQAFILNKSGGVSCSIYPEITENKLLYNV
ncbi:hypothetical protein MHK_006179, partial [Candidatus Magnetomorum sp. HK-1]